jgi:F-type H+-transporting ATPase subunit delta
MSDNSTVARPYAKALFEFAIDRKQLAKWAHTLEALALIASDSATMDFIQNPSISHEQHGELVFSVLNQIDTAVDKEYVGNLLSLLAENNRLQVLPSICFQYDLLRAEYEKTLAVEVLSYAPLTKTQEENIIEKLSKKLGRSVSLNVTIDKSLQGGAVIRAGHLVFDASVGTQIKKLSGTLAA